MEILVHKTNHDFQFIAENQTSTVDICASAELSPYAKGFRPTELLLAGLGGCLSIDIQNIMVKQKAKLNDLSMRITATREEEIPHVFKTIQIELGLNEALNEKKLLKAVKLAADKYCTVYKILSSTAEITITYKFI